MEQDRTSFVKDQLRSVSSSKRLGSTYSFVLCPFHSEKTPSFQIRHDASKPRSVGWGQCRGCGATHKWNDFAHLLGLQPFGPPSPEGKFEKMPMTHYDDVLFGEAGSKVEYKPYSLSIKNWNKAIGEDKRWRSFTREQLLSIGAAFVIRENPFGSEYFIKLPVNVHGKEVGWIHARLKKHETFPSYLNMSGIWSKKKGLFLFDQSMQLMKDKDLTTIVLVEGPRDALRLFFKGIPAICILGTQSWTTAKLRCLESIGADYAIICMDGDPPGRDATRLLIKGQRKTKEGYDQVADPMSDIFRVINFKLYTKELGSDPGNMSMDMIKELRSLLR